MNRLHVLISYHYFRKVDLDTFVTTYFEGADPVLFLDSGAYSAMTQGAQINLREYAAYIKRFRHRLTTYANLDVIRDAEGTWRNQQAMEDLDLHPMPAFHAGEDFDYLARYLDRGDKYIGLGGISTVPSDSYLRWLVTCFRMATGHAVFHGFGVTAPDPLKLFPWYSIDSTSWGQGFKFGQVPVFYPDGRFLKRLAIGDRADVYGHAPLLRAYGFNPETFAVHRQATATFTAGLGALAFLALAGWLKQRHGPIAYPGKPEVEVGPHLYLAEVQGLHLRRANRALQRFLSETAPAHPGTLTRRLQTLIDAATTTEPAA